MEMSLELGLKGTGGKSILGIRDSMNKDSEIEKD